MPQDRKALAGIEQTGDRRAKVTLVTVTSYVFVFAIIVIFMQSHFTQSGDTYDWFANHIAKHFRALG